MGVPKKQKTKARKGTRRSHHALKKTQFSICPKCKSAMLPHTMCPNCGYYAGREVVDVMAKLDKKERKKKEKEEKKRQEEREAAQAEKPAQGPLNVEELSKKK